MPPLPNNILLFKKSVVLRSQENDNVAKIRSRAQSALQKFFHLPCEETCKFLSKNAIVEFEYLHDYVEKIRPARVVHRKIFGFFLDYCWSFSP